MKLHDKVNLKKRLHGISIIRKSAFNKIKQANIYNNHIATYSQSTFDQTRDLSFYFWFM